MYWWWPTKRKIVFVNYEIRRRRHHRYDRRVHALVRNRWKMYAPKLSPIGPRTTRRITMNSRGIAWIMAAPWDSWNTPEHDDPWTICWKAMQILWNKDFRLAFASWFWYFFGWLVRFVFENIYIYATRRRWLSRQNRYPRGNGSTFNLWTAISFQSLIKLSAPHVDNSFIFDCESIDMVTIASNYKLLHELTQFSVRMTTKNHLTVIACVRWREWKTD